MVALVGIARQQPRYALPERPFRPDRLDPVDQAPTTSGGRGSGFLDHDPIDRSLRHRAAAAHGSGGRRRSGRFLGSIDGRRPLGGSSTQPQQDGEQHPGHALATGLIAW